MHNNYMAPEGEKKLACMVCRHRKVACDRRRPKCGLCEKNNFDCQYKARDHRPGLRAGYVSQLEKRVDDLERRMDEVVGQLSYERSRHIEPAHAETETTVESSIASSAPQVSYDNAEGVNIAQPDDLRLNHDAYAPVALGDPTEESLKFELQESWLRNYQPWFPILHRTTVVNAFSTTLPGQTLIQKAIMAVTIWDMPGMLPEHKQSHSKKLHEEVVLSAMASSRFSCLQALLVLAMLSWGEGKWSECGHLLAICKRMSQRLGLSTIAGVTKAQPSRLSSEPFDTFAINPTIDREERIRAFWTIEMLESIFALGSTSPFATLPITATVNLPGSETAWALENPFGEDVPVYNLRYSSGFSMCISLCTIELGAVHNFQQTVRESGDMVGGLEWQSAAQRLDERLTIWREEFVASVFRLINTEYPLDTRAEMEPFIILTNCVLNMAVIVLLQSQTSLPPEIGAESEPWPYANHRCMYACENMAAKIRRMEDNELRNCSPCLVLPIFTAARFYIAVAEHRTPVHESALPIEFYDLRYSVVEICDLLESWAATVSSSFM
ncbi:hypothetical protein N7456_005335 [Penicillium angulare]|uniref:Zn(2)-C6 fungal-type domain-containing protein n=1 Tax=Penicillium angulare TaxID=116970 RepID=A0A9W9KJH4_9EURO|nr:hypothetical protein N7456_005335 [Penicillium angulare]